MSLYSDGDLTRLIGEASGSSFEAEEYRSDWRRDYARVIHSPSFRRLQGKTQLFPGVESDFFRNRLTHSLEVAQIGRSMAERLNHRSAFLKDHELRIEPDIVEVAGLCHDLGHAPFGHNGEHALDKCMRSNGGFEGNAQCLRILTRLEKKVKGGDSQLGISDKGEDQRGGLNLTSRIIASVLKYDDQILYKRRAQDSLQKGYYTTEQEIVDAVKKNIIGDNKYSGIFRVIECSIMDIADDIAYSTYDLEDSFKARFISPFDLLGVDGELAERIAEQVGRKLPGYSSNDVRRCLYEVFEGIFSFPPDTDLSQMDFENPKTLVPLLASGYQTSRELTEDSYLRVSFTSKLVGEFIRGVDVKPNEENPCLSEAYLEQGVLEKVEVLKHFTYLSLILSPLLKVPEYRSKEIVSTIFGVLSNVDNEGWHLLPEDWKQVYERTKPELKERVICDFIAGMTDRYALEFYGRLTSENPESIFKPI